MDGCQPLDHVPARITAPEQHTLTPPDLRCQVYLHILHVVPCDWQDGLLKTHDVCSNSRFGNLDSLKCGSVQQTSRVQDLYAADPASCSVVCVPP